MGKRMGSKRELRSVDELEQKFFPESADEGLRKLSVDPEGLGIALAKESVDRVKPRLVLKIRRRDKKS